jgi:7-cyano-7-deazaguanine synthase
MTVAIALVSGGLDSCVALAEAVAEAADGVAVMHATYGQRTASREHRAFVDIADHYGLSRRLEVDLGHLRQIGGSSLTDPSIPVPTADAHDAVPTTYVPFRNANLLSAAVAWAEAIGAREIVCGAHGPGSAYPDTQPAFFDAFNRLVEIATPVGVHIDIRAPLLHMDKTGIVRRGAELAAPLHLTWSCYEDADHSCGACHSCRLRAKGFAAAGISDPLESLC